MVYTSPYGNFPPCNVPVHQIELTKIDEVIEIQPNRIALINAKDPKDAVTYSQLKEQVLSVSQFLHEHGFSRQIACTVTSNCLQYLPLFLGVSLQGGAVTGASAMFTKYELRRQFVNSGCTLIFTDRANLDKTRRAAEGLAHVKTIIVNGDVAPTGCFSWREVVETKPVPDRSFPFINVKEDLVILLYSSGTTGTPKGVMLTHENYGTRLNIEIKLHERSVKAQGRNSNAPGNTQLHMLPFYHIFGFHRLIMGIVCKCSAVIMSKFEPHLFCRSIQDYKIPFIATVPPILAFLAKDPICDSYDLSSLKTIGCGAAPVGTSQHDALRNRFPAVQSIPQKYGMTELSGSSHIANHTKFGSCGKLAPGMQMKGAAAGCGGRDLFEGSDSDDSDDSGYLGREQETRETIRDGWLHTGDIGYTDADGDLFIVDRLKEIIKVNGLQVAPAELESLLLTHPSIDDVAVIGIPDEKAGEVPKAYIVRKDRALNEQQIAEFIKDKVTYYKQLGGVEFIDAVPKSETGKILRRLLRDRQKSKI